MTSPFESWPVTGKRESDIRLEWDRIASLRLAQISEGRDISFSCVLQPAILDLIQDKDRTTVLDVGCGVGVLTARVAATSHEVTGIDISCESIDLAKRHFSGMTNLRFLAMSVEEFAAHSSERFTLVTANMMLMTALDLDTALGAILRLMAPRGRFIFTVTHPCFFPGYWHYEQEGWFDYSREILIEAPFRISMDGRSDFVTTHIHRPLEQYFEAIARCGLAVLSVVEPRPQGEVPAEYLRNWRFPRFLGMVCSARPSGRL